MKKISSLFFGLLLLAGCTDYDSLDYLYPNDDPELTKIIYPYYVESERLYDQDLDSLSRFNDKFIEFVDHNEPISHHSLYDYILQNIENAESYIITVSIEMEKEGDMINVSFDFGS